MNQLLAAPLAKQQEIDDLKIEIERLKTENAEIGELKKEITKLKTENAELRQCLGQKADPDNHNSVQKE